MKLEEYLEEGGKQFPKTLELPLLMTTMMSKLYKEGEERGIEFGRNLTYDEASGMVVFSDLYVGLSGSVSIRTMSHFENFGDVHSHPTESIGHLDGYASHSMEDFTVFENHLHKPIFIRFVVSGERIYAVIYRKGVTTFDKSSLIQIRDEVTKVNSKYFEKICPYSHDKINEMMMEMNSNKEMNDLMIKIKLQTKGLGEQMEKTSIKACIKVASTYKYGFYIGDAKGLKLAS